MRGQLVTTTWEPSAASSAVGPVTVEAFVPHLLEHSPVPSLDIVAYAAELEARIRILQSAGRDVQLDAVARMLLRSEAVSSSRIEGLQMGHRRLARAEVGRHDIDAAAVIDNVQAAGAAVQRARHGVPLDLAELLRMHEHLVRSDPRMARHAGRVRHEQNWIGGNATTPAGAEFIPPPPAMVPELLEDMFRYANTEGFATLHAAAVHAQFETIHPFADGNGRVGRILIVAQLARQRLAPTVIPPISLAFAGAADHYVTGLTSWRYGDANDWYLTFLNALATATDAITGLEQRLVQLRAHWFSALGRPRSHSATAALLQQLAAHPILNVREGAALTGHSEVAVRRALHRLAEAGIVRRLMVRPGKQAWEVVGVFSLLDELERDLGDIKRAPRHTK